jgi:hypothetical protein
VRIPYANYGFLMIGPGGTFFSGSGNGESSSDTTSNFAFFRNANLGGTWWVGVEDLPNPIDNERLGDYNDMIFRVSTVPIPSAVLLLACGLLRLAAYRRKFSKG